MQYSQHIFMTNQCQEIKMEVEKLIEAMKATFDVTALSDY